MSSGVELQLTPVVIVCREAARGDQLSHPAYLARFIHAMLDKAHQSRAPSRAGTPTRNPHLQSLASTTPTHTAPAAPSPSGGAPPRASGMGTPGGAVVGPVGVHKTTPDQWWDEVGQFAYQEPLQPEQLDFWDGFPLLAGAMSSLSPLIPGRVGNANSANGNGGAHGGGVGGGGVAGHLAVDPMDPNPFAGLAWDAEWDVGFLGLSHAPPMN